MPTCLTQLDIWKELIHLEENRQAFLETWNKEKNNLLSGLKGGGLSGLFKGKEKRLNHYRMIVQYMLVLLDFGYGDDAYTFLCEASSLIEQQKEEKDADILYFQQMIFILTDLTLARFGRATEFSYVKRAESYAESTKSQDILFWVQKARLDYYANYGKYNNVMGLSSLLFDLIKHFSQVKF